MDLLFESQTKGLIKTSQDNVTIIFSTFSEKRTFIGRSKDPSDKKHMSAVIEQFRDRFSVVDSAESEAPKRGAAPESETFDIKKRQNTDDKPVFRRFNLFLRFTFAGIADKIYM